MTQRYNLGFHKEKIDSVTKDSVRIIQEFVPVTSFIHTLQVDLNGRKYISYDDEQNQKYFEHNYLGNDSIDKTRRSSIKIPSAYHCTKDLTNGLRQVSPLL